MIQMRIVWLGVRLKICAIRGHAKAPPTPQTVEMTEIKAKAAGFILRFWGFKRQMVRWWK